MHFVRPTQPVFIVVLAIFGLACPSSESFGQHAAEQQAAVQNYMRIIPQLGPSVARVEITRAGEVTSVGGFIAGQSDWILTLNEFVPDDDLTAAVSFKKSAPYQVASVRYRDWKTGLVVLELRDQLQREPLKISRSAAKPKELELILGIPQQHAVEMSFGYKGKTMSASRIKTFAATTMNRATKVTQFLSQGTSQGLGTPILGADGSVVGMVVGIKPGAQTEVYSISPAEINRVLEFAKDPKAAVAAHKPPEPRRQLPADEEMPGKSVSPAAVAKSTAIEPAQADPAEAKLRTWTASNGNFSKQAKFVQQKSGKVQLELESGKKIVVEISKLCDADQTYLRDQTGSH